MEREKSNSRLTARLTVQNVESDWTEWAGREHTWLGLASEWNGWVAGGRWGGTHIVVSSELSNELVWSQFSGGRERAAGLLTPLCSTRTRETESWAREHGGGGGTSPIPLSLPVELIHWQSNILLYEYGGGGEKQIEVRVQRSVKQSNSLDEGGGRRRRMIKQKRGWWWCNKRNKKKNEKK